MPDPNSKSQPGDSLDTIAMQWFVRRDRGLSASEQAEYASWLREEDHAAAMARVEALWQVLDPVFADSAARDAEPDPDLLARPRHTRAWLWVPLLAAAAAVAFMLLRPAAPPSVAEGQTIVHPAPERLTLEDGSRVDLNGTAKIEVQFTAAERRVTLVQGEAFFTVAKNPARPFIVSAGRVNVRAIGTAFSVDLNHQEISVMVTEGRVGVNEALAPADDKSTAQRELAPLGAGQKGVVALGETAASSRMTITDLTAAQIDQALSWQGVRLEFIDRSLGAIAADFNRYNRKQLVVRDPATAAIRVGGKFRAGDVDDFVRFLRIGFEVSASPHGDEIILQKTPRP